MATPRRQLVDPDNPLFYHVVSRCVRRSWLCGFDRLTRRDYTHRKSWLLQRMRQLGSAFSVDIYAYAIMSNHFHLVVYLDPKAPERWSDEDVADRWLQVCPPKAPDGSVDEALRDLRREMILANPEKLSELRSKLGSLSVFMKFLKQPIARRANLEDDCSGHFFDQRFYSGALLSEEAVIAAMAYVDLNPIRAEIAATIATADHTSIQERLLSGRDGLNLYLDPVVAGIGNPPPFLVPLDDYVEKLEVLIPQETPPWSADKLKRWHDQVFALKRRQRVYGPEPLISRWLNHRGWRARELPLPS